jgi:hypothetical protein
VASFVVVTPPLGLDISFAVSRDRRSNEHVGSTPCLFPPLANIFLPQARTDWINLRVFDFPDFVSFNSELHRIVVQFQLCDQTITEAELIEKILSTFSSAIAILSQ